MIETAQGDHFNFSFKGTIRNATLVFRLIVCYVPPTVSTLNNIKLETDQFKRQFILLDIFIPDFDCSVPSSMLRLPPHGKLKINHD